MVGSRIRVMIVDDHDMFRNGLAILLEAFPDLGLAGAVTNGEEAIQLCDRIETDVVLMDLIMPKMDGIAATRILRQRYPQVQVVALLSFGEEELLEEVMKAGAVSYLFKSAPIDHMAETIRAAAAGDSTPQPDTAPRERSPLPLSHEPSGVQSKERQVPQVGTGMDRGSLSTSTMEVSKR
jgi:NarL family two-component system response regulator LiaR